MSIRYSVEGITFYKVDVDINEGIIKSQGVQAGGFSVELPVVVLYKNGTEEKRFPMKDKKGNILQAKYYSKKEIINYFDLERIYVECTSNVK